MPKRVLVISNTIDAGGAETFVMKVFRCLDKSKFCFDFLINVRESTFYMDEIQSLGGEIFYGYPKSKNPIKSFSSIYKTVKSGKYKTVFCIAVHPLGCLDLLAARLAGAKTLLMRSANSAFGGKLSRLAAAVCRPLVRMLSTVMLAPSSEAGYWMFGDSAVKKGNVNIITNGIDMSLYAFDPDKRAQLRAELGIEQGAFVVGHVGRFNTQKNHSFLVEVFEKITAVRPNSKLVLVGDGELLQDVRQQVNSLGLSDSVLFIGIRRDVPELFSAMDVLLFPSLFEGLPNVVVEAQASGLPCFLSDAISPEVRITELVHFISLQDAAEKWAAEVAATDTAIRTDVREEMTKKGYSIEKTASFLAGRF